jgi:hypothetical protein
LLVITEHHVAVAVHQHGARCGVLDALGEQERRLAGDRVVPALEREAHARELRRDLFVEVAEQFCAALRVLAFAADGDATRERGAQRVEGGGVVEDGHGAMLEQALAPHSR